MSILIKGMEIPSEQYGKMVITLYPNGHVAEYVGDMGRVWEAVPVPPHGDLIDRDALMQHEVLLLRDGGRLPIIYASYVRNAPTIIPAEEGE